MNLAPPIPRLGRPAADGDAISVERTMVNRTPVKSRAGAVRRERHQADYVILVVVLMLETGTKGRTVRNNRLYNSELLLM